MLLTKSKEIEKLKIALELTTLENKSLKSDLNNAFTKIECLQYKYKILCKNYNGLRKKYEKILSKMAI